MLSFDFNAFVDAYGARHEDSINVNRFIAALQQTTTKGGVNGGGEDEAQMEALVRLAWLGERDIRVSSNVLYRLVDMLTTTNLIKKQLSYMAIVSMTDSDHEGCLMLNNLVMKDLQSGDLYACLYALTFLNNFRNVGLTTSLLPIICSLAASTKPLIRKKALAVFPQLFRKKTVDISDFYEVLRDRLDDSDQGVLNVTMACILEASFQNPTNCVIFLPKAMQLLKTSSNVLLHTRILRYLRNIAQVEHRVGSIIEDELTKLMV
eukprot:Gregarina_sp_Poly_1__3700@NODE_2093_length_2692_cov_42_825143_g1350_i0_p1_GENE_NODE_2093_length_2692_cov_42_825143_g1350_i0NODE_2093_length_2692_cov_42_825143_g1350_i0_p1_ORF_typecomplete_len263_score35_18Adaptin_N/PF01602_20/1e27Cnd1/PF12717_7/1_9e03Cnd1/PF12717_7/1_2e05INTS5_C/PF14838_6/0_11_NODE_2093_length_2692_cov_42_825143_g1350_i09251713